MSFKILNTSGGKISWREFENKKVGLKKQLFFDIEVDVVYKLGTTECKGKIVLNFISLKDVGFQTRGFLFNRHKYFNWSDLDNIKFSFPTNPTPGYIDGSLYFAHRHNSCDVTELAFKRINEQSFQITFSGAIDFEYEGTDREAGVKKYEFSDLSADVNIT